MFKKLILAIMIALPVSLFAQKFGVVDPEAVITKMPEFTAMQTEIANSSKEFEKEFANLQQEFEKKYTEFQALPEDTPQSIKERRVQELQELDQKATQFRNTVTQDLQRQQEQMMAPIQQKFNDAVKAVGQEGSYTFILPVGVSLYDGEGVVDITSAVMAKLGIQ